MCIRDRPWDYDPAVVHAAVDKAIARSEKADAEPAPPARATETPTESEPKKQAVMERPGADPDASTDDLAGVCTAG